MRTIPKVRRKRSKLCFSTWPGSMEGRGSWRPPLGLFSRARSSAALCTGLSVIVAMVAHDVGAALVAALGQPGALPLISLGKSRFLAPPDAKGEKRTRGHIVARGVRTNKGQVLEYGSVVICW
jgi:hypothetical protein